MVFNKLMEDAIDICITKFSKEQTKKKIIKPVVDVILETIGPYILAMCIFFATMILLIICILYVILTK